VDAHTHLHLVVTRLHQTLPEVKELALTPTCILHPSQ
jgi:hypothetical protein